MIDPVIGWEPAQLRSIGFAFSIFGASVVVMSPLAGANPKQRLVLSGTLAVGTYHSLGEFPHLTGLISAISVLMAFSIPLGLTLALVRDVLSE